MNAKQRLEIHQIAASEARFVMAADESFHDALYRAITAILYLAFEVLHPDDPFPSLSEIEFADSGISVEFYWDGELILDHATIMTFCKSRKCTLAQIRSAFQSHEFSAENLRIEEEKHLERHSKPVTVIPVAKEPPRLNLKRTIRRLG